MEMAQLCAFVCRAAFTSGRLRPGMAHLSAQSIHRIGCNFRAGCGNRPMSEIEKLVNRLDNLQPAKLNFGALQMFFPCLQSEVGPNLQGMVSQVDLTDSAVRCAFGPFPGCQPFLDAFTIKNFLRRSTSSW